MTASRRHMVAGNWKMNGSRASIDALVCGIIDAGPFGCDVLLLPPSVFLEQVRGLVLGSSVLLGGQNLDWRDQGAFTGEVSAPMLAEMGCGYCLVGHSERRSLFAETDEVVAQKFRACIGHDIRPLLCVGETLAERQAGITMDVIRRQLEAVIEAASIGAFASAIVAYEPVWAIGTGESASPEQAAEVHAFIRQAIAGHDAEIAEQLQILYGGSVNGANAADLLGQEDIDGALVGGASLKAEDFAAICRAA